MARLYVPEDYSSIADAVSDASSGDVIVVADGTYAEGAISATGKTGITIRASNPYRGVHIEGSFEVGDGWHFRGLDIYNPTTTIIDAGSLTVYIVECDLGLAANTYGVLCADDSKIARCRFYNYDGGSSFQAILTDVTTNPIWVYSCTFDELDTGEDNLIADVLGPGAYANVYNCTFNSCVCADTLIVGDSVVANVITDCEASTYAISANTGHSYNCVYGLTGGGTPWASAGTGDFTTDPQLDDNLVPGPGSPCNSVSGNTASYGNAVLDFDRFPFPGTASSVGAKRYRAPGSMLSAEYVDVDPWDGLFVWVSSVETACTGDTRSFDCAYDLAWGVELAVAELWNPEDLLFVLDVDGTYRTRVHTTAGGAEIKFYTDTEAGRLFTSNQTTYFASVTDSSSHINGPLSVDARSYYLSAPLHEDVSTSIHTSTTEFYPTGRSAGRSVPASDVRELGFSGVTGSVELYNDAFTDITGIYLAGAKLRVYRDWPGNVSLWTVSNQLGWSDVLPFNDTSVTGWYSNVMMRYEFEIEGTTSG